jgi:hypothetical protein
MQQTQHTSNWTFRNKLFDIHFRMFSYIYRNFFPPYILEWICEKIKDKKLATNHYLNLAVLQHVRIQTHDDPFNIQHSYHYTKEVFVEGGTTRGTTALVYWQLHSSLYTVQVLYMVTGLHPTGLTVDQGCRHMSTSYIIYELTTVSIAI